MTSALKPLKIVSVSEQVAAGLRNTIISGQFKEGDVLNLHELAQAFGVSNTPVRSAMQILANDGLVLLRPNKGAVVIGMSAKRVKDYYQVRTLLEGGAAQTACSAPDLAIMTTSFEQAENCVRQKNWEEYAMHNRHFHQAIWELCGNEKMFEILSNLWNTSSRPSHSTAKDYVLYSHAEHRKIYEAIMRRDPEEAKAQMHAHLERSLKDILTYYESV